MSEKAKGLAIEQSVSQAATHWRQLNLWPRHSLKWVDYLTGADNNPNVFAASNFQIESEGKSTKKIDRKGTFRWIEEKES